MGGGAMPPRPTPAPLTLPRTLRVALRGGRPPRPHAASPSCAVGVGERQLAAARSPRAGAGTVHSARSLVLAPITLRGSDALLWCAVKPMARAVGGDGATPAAVLSLLAALQAWPSTAQHSTAQTRPDHRVHAIIITMATECNATGNESFLRLAQEKLHAVWWHGMHGVHTHTHRHTRMHA